jgi:hypothetical protein
LSRELQIIDALAELSLDRSEVDLESIQVAVQRRQDELLPDTWKQVARQALRTLAGLGMVQIDSDENARLRYEQVRLTEQFLNAEVVRVARANRQELPDRRDDRAVKPEHGHQLTSSEAVNTRDGGGRRGNGGNGFGEGDGGGEGFREVLAHPYLFSLSKTDFDDILNQI